MALRILTVYKVFSYRTLYTHYKSVKNYGMVNLFEGHVFDTIAQQAWKRYESEMSHIEMVDREEKCFYRALTLAETKYCQFEMTKGDHNETLQQIAEDPKNGYSDAATKASTREVTEAAFGATDADDAKATTPQVDTSGNNGSSSKWDKNWYTISSKWSKGWYNNSNSASKDYGSWNETPNPDGNVLPQPVWDSPPTATHDKEVQGGSSCSKSAFLSDAMKSTYEEGSAKAKSSEKGKKKKSKKKPKKSKKSKDKEDGSSSSSGSSSGSDDE
ncbi:hypothetical protein FOZ60_013259 [Perkinsus olseni]|uniref:Uncharacterized protein n=1 Tax=Perkinsus olseni TaxID=32597 RepID=A0A7J6N9Y1_PEROL|nr:hypothetical protein FOZ60_013259 [Perkinsus olseni]